VALKEAINRSMVWRLRLAFAAGWRDNGSREKLFMIDTVTNLLFRCPHHRLTRPMAPITKAGTPHSQSYVVCLDCGKQFEYDLSQMRLGKPIDHSHEHAVVPPTSRGKKSLMDSWRLYQWPYCSGPWKGKKKTCTAERGRSFRLGREGRGSDVPTLIQPKRVQPLKPSR